MPRAKSEESAARDARREARREARMERDTLKRPLAPEVVAAVAGMPGVLREDFQISVEIAQAAVKILERQAKDAS
jgi:hypothetical protein